MTATSPSLIPDSFDHFLSRVSARLINSSAVETRSCIEEVLAGLGEYLNAARCYLFEFHPDHNTMSNTHEWVNEGITSHISELQNLARDQLPYFFERMKADHRFIINDVDALPDEARAEQHEFQREGIRSMMCVGVVMRDELLGFLGCDVVTQPHAWSEAEIQRLGLVANMIANAMDRERTYQELIAVRNQLAKANRKLERQANQDGLTGIANRRALDRRLTSEVKRAKRTGSGLALLLIDVDCFKEYNDHYGHLAGDQVLRHVARTLEQTMQRSTDFVARYGGEEFAVVISEDSREQAQRNAHAAITAVRNLGIVHGYSPVEQVITISLGGFFNQPSPDDAVEASVKHLLMEADRAVYQAKSEGRNRVCFR